MSTLLSERETVDAFEAKYKYLHESAIVILIKNAHWRVVFTTGGGLVNMASVTGQIKENTKTRQLLVPQKKLE